MVNKYRVSFTDGQVVYVFATNLHSAEWEAKRDHPGATIKECYMVL